MSFPTIAEITSYTGTGNLSPHLVPMNAVVNAGDALIMFFEKAGAANSTIVTPTGWTLLGTNNSGNFNAVQAVFGKIAIGNEGGTTVSVDIAEARNASAQTYRINVGSWWGTLATGVLCTTVNENTATPNPPAASPSWGTADLLCLVSSGRLPNHTVTSYPSGYTNGTYSQSSATNSILATARKTVNAASEDPGIYTFSSSAVCVTATVLVRPAIAVPTQASVSGTATVTSSSLKTVIKLQSTQTVTATISAALSVGIRQRANATGTATSTASLKTLIRFKGAVSCTATVAADFAEVGMPTGTYYFKVVAVDQYGEETNVSNEAFVTVLDAANQKIHLSWNAHPHAINIRVYKGEEAHGEDRYKQLVGSATSYDWNSDDGAIMKAPPTQNLARLHNIFLTDDKDVLEDDISKFNGVAVSEVLTSLVESKDYVFGNEGIRKEADYWAALFKVITSPVTIVFGYLFDYDPNKQKTKTVDLSVPEQDQWDETNWDSGTWAVGATEYKKVERKFVGHPGRVFHAIRFIFKNLKGERWGFRGTSIDVAGIDEKESSDA